VNEHESTSQPGQSNQSNQSSPLVYGVATREWSGWQSCLASWSATASAPYPFCIVRGKTVVEAFQEIYEQTTEPILAYLHDDLLLHEPNWDQRVLREFTDPTVGAVGFGGAARFGHPQIYQLPYELMQLARFEFQSNMRNAEDHGIRFTGARDVAILDGFAMFIRREVLDRAGGWPVGTPVNYYMNDNWLACQLHRQGLRTRLVGVDCDHLSGKTSSITGLTDDHAAVHRWFYDEFRDCLPIVARG
jgi:hypothetical protein